MADTPTSASSTLTRSLMESGQAARARISSFGVLYVGIFLFLIAYLYSVRVSEHMLSGYFQRRAAEAVDVGQLDQPIVTQIQMGIRAAIDESVWVRWGGVRVTTLVLGSDGLTWLYVDGRVLPQPEGLGPTDVLREAVNLLPATADVNVTVPHNSLLANSILVLYAAVLLQGLYLHYRITTRREAQQLALARLARDETAARAARIEAELDVTRQRLGEIEPVEREHSEEIRTLQAEREGLRAKLQALAAREEELRSGAARAVELSQEMRALEDLLDEAGADLASKEEEINRLGKNLKRVEKTRPTGGRSRSNERLSRRLRTLYKSLEIDERAVTDLVALRDETMQLKAEEQIKRLCEEADNVSVRRKVGGLPEHLTIFELGFAGKGRIYYTKGRQGRFRILAVGAKNTQDADLEYLRRLDRGERT
jgi:hypothetical protein